MSELDSQYVKRGFWINRSQGVVMGPTITTDTKTGALVTALLAVFTTLAMGHLWNLINFLWYQIRADGRTAEGLFQQQQALFRTLPSPSTLTTDSLKLFFVWRTKTKDRVVLYQSLISAVLAFVFALATLAAGIFSSYAVTGSNIEVLVASPLCGLVGSSRNLNSTSERYLMKAADDATQYADECYQQGVGVPTRCNVFAQPTIGFTVDLENTSCPFHERMCNSTAIGIDTGFLAMDRDFGLNLNPDEGVRVRWKSTCVILSQDGLTTKVDAAAVPKHLLGGRDPIPGERTTLYHLGTTPGAQAEWSNATFGQSSVIGSLSQSYSLRGFSYSPSWPYYPIDVIPELKSENATTVIIVVGKGGKIFYQNPFEDPLFSAHKEVTTFDTNNGINRTFFASDEPTSLLGCSTQYQFCATTGSIGEKCTGLVDLPENMTQYILDDGLPDVNDLQMSLLDATQIALQTFQFMQIPDMNVSIMNRGGGLIESLPSDQWIREITRWASISLAGLQTLLSDYAVGPAARDATAAQNYIIPPPSKGGKRLCTMQRMRKPGGFVNIFVFPLALIVTFSVTVIVLDLTILRFLIFLGRFKTAFSPRSDRWIQDGVFQLQRRAYEAQGDGPWADLNKEVPVTAGGVRLSNLPLTKWSSASTLSSQSQTTGVPGRSANSGPSPSQVSSPTTTPTGSQAAFPTQIPTTGTNRTVSQASTPPAVPNPCTGGAGGTSMGSNVSPNVNNPAPSGVVPPWTAQPPASNSNNAIPQPTNTPTHSSSLPGARPTVAGSHGGPIMGASLPRGSPRPPGQSTS